MTDNRLWVNLPNADAAQAGNLRVSEMLTGPAVPMLRTNGNPNGNLTALAGQLALDYATGIIYQNTDNATAWVVYIGGGGAATVTTAAPVSGNGAPGTPVTIADHAVGLVKLQQVTGSCFLGSNNEAPPNTDVAQLTPTQAGVLLANKVVVSTDGGATTTGTGVTGDPVKAVLQPGRFLGRQIFTANGTYTPTAGTRAVRLRMVGGGGGSGGCAGTAGSLAAGGGGAGIYVETWIIPGAAITGGAVTIGAGGTAGTNAPTAGGNGGDTTIVIQATTYTAKGGTGTAAGVIGKSPGGYGLAGSTITEIVTCGAGQNGVADATSVLGGDGGYSPWGRGGHQAAAQAAGSNTSTGGVATNGFGAGAGGSQSANGPAVAGAAGAPGQIIVEEYT